jgi:hypothetical protein
MTLKGIQVSDPMVNATAARGSVKWAKDKSKTSVTKRSYEKAIAIKGGHLG